MDIFLVNCGKLPTTRWSTELLVGNALEYRFDQTAIFMWPRFMRPHAQGSIHRKFDRLSEVAVSKETKEICVHCCCRRSLLDSASLRRCCRSWKHRLKQTSGVTPVRFPGRGRRILETTTQWICSLTFFLFRWWWRKLERFSTSKHVRWTKVSEEEWLSSMMETYSADCSAATEGHECRHIVAAWNLTLDEETRWIISTNECSIRMQIILVTGRSHNLCSTSTLLFIQYSRTNLEQDHTNAMVKLYQCLPTGRTNGHFYNNNNAIRTIFYLQNIWRIK